MKAFSLYPKEERGVRILLEKMKNYGQMNCSFEVFCRIYIEWHQNTFPGCEVTADTAIMRDDWFSGFVNYIINRDV